jgi:hypothetical protein
MTISNKTQARIYAAKINRDLAASCFDPGFGFASHITQRDKENYSIEQLKLADEIETGEHDHNFTIWQRMNYYETGECIALLS